MSNKELWGIGIPADIIVFTESEMWDKAKFKSTLQYKIVSEGAKIYEAA